MATPAPSDGQPRDLHAALQLSLLRVFFGTVSGVCLIGALAMPVMAQQLGLGMRVAMASGTAHWVWCRRWLCAWANSALGR